MCSEAKSLGNTHGLGGLKSASEMIF